MADKSPKPEEPDVLEKAAPVLWGWLRDRLYVDELYGATVIAFYDWWARVADWLDRRVWGGVVAGGCVGLSPVGAVEPLPRYQLWWMAASTKAAKSWRRAAGCCRGCRSGRVQTYLRLLALAVVALAAILIWSSRA